MDVMRVFWEWWYCWLLHFAVSKTKKISLRTVGAALVLQVVIGGIMLWLPPWRWSQKKSLLASIK